MEELLKNADWASRLALRLVRDQAEADDLVQDLWTVALGRGSEAVVAPRAYLATVMRRLLGQKTRRDKLRRLAEVEKAKASVEQVAASESKLLAMKSLVMALEVLPPDDRQLLLWRYFEGLESSAIGQRLGLKAAALRTRLLRARGLLRDELDRRSRSDGRSWCLPLIPLALDCRALGSGWSTLASAKGVLAMSSAAKLSIPLVLVAVCIWAWQSRDQIPRQLESAPTSSDRAAETSGPRREHVNLETEFVMDQDKVSPVTPRPMEAETVAAIETELPPAEGTCRLTGRVLNQDASPADFALVRVWATEPSALVKATRTDDAGHFELPEMPLNQDLILEARAYATGRRLLRLRLTADQDLGVIRLAGEGRLRGTVRNSSGEGVEEIMLQVLPERLLGKSWRFPLHEELPVHAAIDGPAGLEDAVVVSDSEGRFDLRGLVPGRYFFVSDEEVVLVEAEESFSTGDDEIDLTVQADRLIVELEIDDDFVPDDVMVRVLVFAPDEDLSALTLGAAESTTDASGDEEILTFFVARSCPVLVAGIHDGAFIEVLVPADERVDLRRVKLPLKSPALDATLTLTAQMATALSPSGIKLTLRGPRTEAVVYPFAALPADADGRWEKLPRGSYLAEFEIPAGPWGDLRYETRPVVLSAEQDCAVHLDLLPFSKLSLRLSSSSAKQLPEGAYLEAKHVGSGRRYTIFRYASADGGESLPLALNREIPWPNELPPGVYVLSLMAADDLIGTQQFELLPGAKRSIDFKVD